MCDTVNTEPIKAVLHKVIPGTHDFTTREFKRLRLLYNHWLKPLEAPRPEAEGARPAIIPDRACMICQPGTIPLVHAGELGAEAARQQEQTGVADAIAAQQGQGQPLYFLCSRACLQLAAGSVCLTARKYRVWSCYARQCLTYHNVMGGYAGSHAGTGSGMGMADEALLDDMSGARRFRLPRCSGAYAKAFTGQSRASCRPA